VLADRLDRGRDVPTFEEQHAGRVDHGSTGEAGAGLATPAVVRRVGLDGLGHGSIVSLSIQEYNFH
jgi:hypothetical protein